MLLFRLIAFLLFPLLLVAGPVTILVVVVEPHAIVAATPAPSVQDAGRARLMLSWYKRQITSGAKQVVLSATERDLNTLAAFAARSLPGLNARIDMQADGVRMKASYRLPSALGGGFLNGQAVFPPSEGALRVSRLSLGPLPLPERLLLTGVRQGLDQMLGPGRGAQLMDSVRGLKIHAKAASLVVRPSPGLEAELKKGLAQAAALSDPALVRLYYAKLVVLAGRMGQSRSVSLNHYMAPLFQLARDRSGTPRDGQRAAEENRAATLALAMYFGHWRVEQLIGEVRTGVLANLTPRTGGVSLAGRRDLMQHFLISATLEIAAGKGVAFAAGEFKELLDAGHGGSGFSFVDLAADRAGIRFAQIATDASGGATRMQDLLATAKSEGAYFPSIAGLPEWLSEKAFEKKFGGVGGDAYLKLVREIDRRIAGRPAYAGR
jgi:hypothetical protein